MNIENDLVERIPQETRNRGGCLTAFLIVGLAVFSIGALYLLSLSLFGYPAYERAFPGISRGYLAWGAFLGMANFIAFLGIWWWRKWGVYAFIAISIIGFLVDISRTLGGGVFNLIRSVILVTMLLFLIRGKWSKME